MKLVKLAAGVVNQTPLDWEQNQKNIQSCIEMSRERGVSLLCLPELCITGYGCEDAFHSPNVSATALEILAELAPMTKGMAVSLGLPLAVDGSLYNVACLVVDGRPAGFVAKQHLAGDGIHYEPRWFKPWPAGVRTTFDWAGQTYPLGDFFFEVDGVRVGFEICEDAWVGERPGADLAARGVDILLNPSASHFAFGKHEIRQRFVLEGSRAFQVSYVYANLLGNESGRAIFDGDAMIASRGRMLASGPRFSYRDAILTTAVVDVDMSRMERSRVSSYQPDPESAVFYRYQVAGDWRIPDLESACSDTESASAAVSATSASELVPSVLLPDDQTTEAARRQAECDESTGVGFSTPSKEVEFTLAVSLALFDYVRKSRSRGVVISLSGGADSAAVAMLSRLMLEFSARELGKDAARRKLAGDLLWQEAVTSERDGEKIHETTGLASELGDWAAEQILTVYQATRNSGATTQNAAKAVAEAIQANHHEMDIDELVVGYTSKVSSAIGRDLQWDGDDIALQNIQARTRSPGVWMFANLRNALLLSTSNRSEAAVGYATMDGDTSGGLSPIAGIDKAFLRRWLRWMEQTGPKPIGPLAVLRVINDQQPTAELRPQASRQTDEDDLMPYDILDAIERWAIRDKRFPLEVDRMLAAARPDLSDTIRVTWIKRFFQLWSRNQWKRERYAPSFHLDDENLDPKTWCRFPILSGGFRRELLALEQKYALEE